jgi:hypothetical protein
MARIQYQPTARSRGFRPQQLSTAGIDRMREESNRLIQGMERRRRAEKEERDTHLQAMKEDAAYTERITLENNATAMRNLQNEGQQKLANIQGKSKQSQIDYEANISILNSLTSFSQAAVKAIGEKQKQKLEEEQERANEIPIDARPPEEVEARIRGEQAQVSGGIKLATENNVEAVLSNEDPLETKKTQLSNPAFNGIRDSTTRNRRFAIEGGMVAAARYRDNETLYTAADGRQFTGTQASHNEYFSRELQRITVGALLKEAGVTDPLQMREGLKQVNDVFDAYHRQARTAEGDLNDAALEQRAKDTEAGGTIEAITVAFVDRKTAFGAAKAHDGFQKLIANPDIPLEELKKADFNGNGKPYAEEWPKRWNPAMQKRREAIVKRAEFEERQKKAEDMQWVNSSIDSIQEAYNQNPQQTALLVKQRYHGKAMTVPPPITAIEREAFKKNRDLMEHTILERIKFKILDLPFVNSIQDPQLQKMARAGFEKQELEKYGPEAGLIKGQMAALARKRTGIDPNSQGTSPTTALLNAAMVKRYDENLEKYKNPLTAWEKTQDQIDAEKDDPTALFYEDPAGAAKNKPFFPNIETSSRERVEMDTYIDKELLRIGRSLADKPFALANSLEMDAAYTSSLSGAIQYPAGIIRYAESTGTKPSEAFNTHRMANNAATGANKPLLTPTPASIMVDAAPPWMRKLFLSEEPSLIRRAGAQMSGRVANAVRPSMIRAYTSGNIGPTSTGPHLDVKRVDGGRFEPNALDEYVVVNDPEFGQVSLGQIRELTNNVGDNFDEHVARGSHGIDYGLESGTEIFLKNGASVVSSEPTEHGDYVVIELPNGDRYSFLHGKR